MKFLAIALLLVAGSSASPKNILIPSPIDAKEERLVEGVIISAIEYISQRIQDAGYDPLEVPRLAVEYVYPNFEAQVKAFVEELLFTGASNIAVNTMDYSVLFSRLQFDLSLPELSLVVGDSGVELIVSGNEYDGQLKGSLSIRQIRIAGEVRINVGIISGITVRSLSLDFTLGGMNSEFSVTLRGNDVSDNVNVVLNDTIPTFIADNRKISRWLSLRKEKLSPMDPKDVNDALLSESHEDTMRLVFLVLSLAALASAGPLQGETILAAFQSNDESARNSVIEQAVLEVLERLRTLFQEGSPSFPQLDPYNRDHVHIYGLLVGLPGSHLTLNDIHATGISSFEVKSLSITLTSLLLQWYRADFEIVVPAIDASVANYDLDVTVWGSRYYGNGEVSLKIEDVRLIGYLDIGVRVNNGIFLNINDARVTLRLSAFNPVITGVFGNDATSDYISEWLSEMVPYLLDLYQEEVITYLSLAIRFLGNLFLEDYNIADLLTREIIV